MQPSRRYRPVSWRNQTAVSGIKNALFDVLYGYYARTRSFNACLTPPTLPYPFTPLLSLCPHKLHPNPCKRRPSFRCTKDHFICHISSKNLQNGLRFNCALGLLPHGQVALGRSCLHTEDSSTSTGHRSFFVGCQTTMVPHPKIQSGWHRTRSQTCNWVSAYKAKQDHTVTTPFRVSVQETALFWCGRIRCDVVS